MILGIGWWLTISLVEAGPPFVTDDPEPPPPGGWEINVPFILDRTPGKTEMDSPLFDFNYGLPNVQLKLEIPIAVVHDDGARHEGGCAGDLPIGMKWRFLNNEQSKFQLGVYPQVPLPTGDRARGLGEGRSAFVFPVVAQKSWDKWTVYGNVGFWWQTAAEERNYFYAGAVLEREITERSTLGVELFGNSPKERGSRSEGPLQRRRQLEVERSPQPALRRWPRRSRRYKRDGLRRIADPHEIGHEIVSS